MTRPGSAPRALWACIFLVLTLSLAACGDDETGTPAPTQDAGTDAGETDASTNNNSMDAGTNNTNMDAGGTDAGETDMGGADAGTCGNGVVEGDEECDDQNMDDTDACQSDCTFSCGNGTVEASEACDTAIAAGMPGACPTVCDSGPACTVGVVTGMACSAACEYDPVTACNDDDGCCGMGCNASTDNDCTASCGNGVVEPGETCDPVGSCPTACDDGIVCTEDNLVGVAGDCTAECQHPAITMCTNGDGCCAPGCDETNDDDCMPSCGNGAVETGETCDGNCPTSCTDDGDPCTVEALTGDPTMCDVACGSTTITMPADNDMCCPIGATAATDNDCTGMCGNGATEPGETCDGNCPTTCAPDGDACTDDSLSGSAGNCDAACNYAPITACSDGDGCCPSACTNANDNDCPVAGGVDPASAVSTTSQCLTAGTGAEAALVVDVVDTAGNPVTGATVQMTTSLGTLSSVTEVGGGEYYATLTPPVAASGTATISITADGITLTAQPQVDFEAPLTNLNGGSGGCPLDGNVRVRVVDGAGTPLANAFVMLGDSENATAFADTYGGAGNAANTARTDANGFAEFVDYGTALDGTISVTGTQANYHYTTIIDAVGSDYVIPVDLIDPMASTGRYTGSLTPIPAPNNSPIELGVMLPDIKLEQIANFSLDALLSDNKCYQAGGQVGNVNVPGNIYIPAQCAFNLFGCLQNLPETDYISPELAFGARKLIGVSGDTPLSAVSGGDIAAALTQLNLVGIGVEDRTVSSTMTGAQDINIDETLVKDVSCAVSNAPASSDVFCVTAGDWDSNGNAAIGPGEGRLSITGFVVDAFAGGTLNITNVARPPLQNDFASLDTIGAVAALYLDGATAPSPGVASGVSAIFDRDADFGTAGNRAMTFSDLFGIPTLNRTGRSLARGSVANAGGTQPAAMYTIHTLTRDVTVQYSGCGTDDSSRTESYTLWKVWAPETSTTFNLPTPPATFPNGGTGDFAGLIDPASTPENDEVAWLSLTIHEGDRPTAFSWGDLLFADFRRYATHVGANSETY